jgi:hypothetical protein
MTVEPVRIQLATALVAAQCRGRVIFEFSLGPYGGYGRADVADIQINTLDGYEIKTKTDSLKRLLRQAEAYSRVFDRCYAVVAPNHLKNTLTAVPDWWGVWVLGPQLELVRPGQVAPCGSGRLLMHILWKTEILMLLRQLGEKPDRNSTMSKLYQQLSPALNFKYRPRRMDTTEDLHDLRAVVRWVLLRRQNKPDVKLGQTVARWPEESAVLAPWPLRPEAAVPPRHAA